MNEAPFPHCDSRVLHAPGECQYCDHYPEEQKARIKNKVAFTGQKPIFDETPCPATLARPLEAINRWGGNVPHPHPKPHPVEWCDCETCTAIMARLKAKNLDYLISGDPTATPPLGILHETKKPRTWQLWLIFFAAGIIGVWSLWLLTHAFGTLTASVR